MTDNDTSTKASHPAKKIVLYSPSLQGFYLGELANQIRQIVLSNGWDISIIRTDGVGEFNSKVATNGVDGAIILKNALSTEYAESLVEQGLPTVSIAYDYFPLEIPHVTSDNALGMEIAFTYLLKRGHRDIAFVGDLSMFDQRIRYEAFCDLHDKHSIPFDETTLIPTNGTSLAGGYQAGKEFIARGCNASAVICGSGVVGMGLVKQLAKSGIELSSNLEVVSFDAVPTVPLITPTMTTVDINLNIVAYRAWQAVTSLIEHKSVERTILVPPKLIASGENNAELKDRYMVTCVEQEQLRDTCYMKSLLTNIYEWPLEIVNSNLDDIMSLAPIFEKYMAVSTLSRIYIDKKGRNLIAMQRIFKHTTTIELDLSKNNICLPELFPPTVLQEENLERFDVEIHFPIFLKGVIWGVLSFWGNSKENGQSSFLAFAGCIDIIVKMYAINLERNLDGKNIADAPLRSNSGDQLLRESQAEIKWNIKTGHSEWSDEALELLSLTSEMEKTIYRNSDIYEKVHDDDIPKLRDEILESIEKIEPRSIRLRLKIKRNYINSGLYINPLCGESEKVEHIKFYLTLIDDTSI